MSLYFHNNNIILYIVRESWHNIIVIIQNKYNFLEGGMLKIKISYLYYIIIRG